MNESLRNRSDPACNATCSTTDGGQEDEDGQAKRQYSVVEKEFAAVEEVATGLPGFYREGPVKKKKTG